MEKIEGKEEVVLPLYEPGDIVGLIGDKSYRGLVMRKIEEQYEILILGHAKSPTTGACKPGQLFNVPKEQVVIRLDHIPITVTEEGEEDRVDFDEEKLKEMGYDLPQL